MLAHLHFVLFIIAGILSFAGVILIVEAYETDIRPYWEAKKERIRLYRKKSKLLFWTGIFSELTSIILVWVLCL